MSSYEGYATACVRSEILTIPNLLTLVRFVCGCVIAFAAGYPSLAFALALVGAITDFFDGWWARTFKCGTEFGERFDQLTDKVFGIALMATVIRIDGWEWYTILPFLCILAYSLSVTALRIVGRAKQSSGIAKWKTALQFAAGVGIVGGNATGFVGGWTLSYLTLWATLPLMWIAWRRYMRAA